MIGLVSRRSTCLKCLGVALCPVLALLGTQMWVSRGGPASASAQPAVDPVTIPEYQPMPEPSEREARAIARIRELEHQSVPSPFPNLAQTEVPEIIQKIGLIAGDPAEQVQQVPELVVTSVMGGRVPVAMVNGRARSVGDRVAPGWTIRQINASGIVIEHVDGRTAEFAIERGSP